MARRRAFRTRTLRASLPLIVLLGAAPATAGPKLQVIAETSLGYTDNVRAMPETPQADAPARSTGAFLVLSPGLVLALESPRTLQHIGYRYEYDLYFAQSNASSSSNRLDYRGLFDLSRRVRLVLGSNVTESNRYTSATFAAPGASLLAALPAGAGAFLQVGADQAFDFDLSLGWRAWQGSSILAEAPILGTDAPQTTVLGLRGGLERSFSIDAAGVEARADYTTVADGIAGDGARLELQRLLVASGVGLWRHDFGRHFTSSVEAGVLRVQRLNTGRGFWSPAGAAALAYANAFGDAQLSYAHTVSTNVLLGHSLLSDEIRLRGALPITPQGDLVLAATAGYQHARLIDENASLAGRIDVVLGDVLLGWWATPALQLGLRYQHIEQRAGAQAPPLPLGFVQNNVLFSAALKLPPDSDMPRPYRAARRVDGADEIREGVRPTAEGPREPAPSAP